MLLILTAFSTQPLSEHQDAATPAESAPVQDERRTVHGLQRTPEDQRVSDAVAHHLARQLEQNVDLDALVELASQACLPPVPEGHPAVSFPQEHHVRLAVARDAAFSMYYSECVSSPSCPSVATCSRSRAAAAAWCSGGSHTRGPGGGVSHSVGCREHCMGSEGCNQGTAH